MERILCNKRQQLLFREILALILSYFTLQNCPKYHFKEKRGYQAQQHNDEKYFPFYTVTESFFFLGTHLRFHTHIPRKLYTKFGTFVRFVTIWLKFCMKRPDYLSLGLGKQALEIVENEAIVFDKSIKEANGEACLEVAEAFQRRETLNLECLQQHQHLEEINEAISPGWELLAWFLQKEGNHKHKRIPLQSWQRGVTLICFLQLCGEQI